MSQLALKEHSDIQNELQLAGLPFRAGNLTCESESGVLLSSTTFQPSKAPVFVPAYVFNILTLATNVGGPGNNSYNYRRQFHSATGTHECVIP